MPGTRLGHAARRAGPDTRRARRAPLSTGERNARPRAIAFFAETWPKPACSSLLSTASGKSSQPPAFSASRNCAVDAGDARVRLRRALARVEHVAERRIVGADGVVGADDALVDAADDEVAEIAHVDELQSIVGRARRQHLAAARDAQRPIDEAIARIAGTDDDAGAQAGRAPGHRSSAARSASDLVAAVVSRRLRASSRSPSSASATRRRSRRSDPCRACRPRSSRRRGIGRRDPRAASAARVHRLRHHDPGVDDRVPLAARAGDRDRCARSPMDRLEVGEERRVGLAAIEQRERVAARARGVTMRGPTKPVPPRTRMRLGLRRSARCLRRRRGRSRIAIEERAAGGSAGERGEKIAAA